MSKTKRLWQTVPIEIYDQVVETIEQMRLSFRLQQLAEKKMQKKVKEAKQ
jgi:hypothetical protein